MFTWLTGGGSAAPKKNNIPEKIEDFKKKLTQENMGLVDKKSQLQMLISANGQKAVSSTNGQRLIVGMRRHHDMMKMYQTSLQALETTLQNLEMQRVTNEVQKLIGRAPRANMDHVEDSLEEMISRDDEMAELSQLMAQHNDFPIDNGDFLAEMGIVVPDDSNEPKPSAAPAVKVDDIPSPPSYLEPQAVPTSASGVHDVEIPSAAQPVTNTAIMQSF